MKTMRKNGLIIAAMALAVCLALPLSCAKKVKAPKETAAPTEKTGQKVIGVSLLVQTHDFYKDLQAGLEEMAAEHGFKLLILSGEMDVNKQIMQVQNFITQQVDAIIVCPADTNTIGTAIMEANKAGIPVFTADIRSASGDIVSHIASDNVMGGREAGMYMAKLFEGKKDVQIGIINHDEASSVQERVKGFLDEIGKHPNMKVSANMNARGLRDAAIKVATDMLMGHPDLDAIFAINDDSALGALTAISEMKRDDIVVVGYDATTPAREAILSGGPLKADVIQYPKKIGRTTIHVIAEHLAGKKVDAEYPIEVGIVDKKALEEGAKFE